MNERIRELARQARYDSKNEKHYLERIHNREITLDEYQEIYDKKFVELIVRECAKAIADDDLEKDCGTFLMDSWAKGMRYSAHLIKEHFGVEEK